MIAGELSGSLCNLAGGIERRHAIAEHVSEQVFFIPLLRR